MYIVKEFNKDVEGQSKDKFISASFFTCIEETLKCFFTIDDNDSSSYAKLFVAQCIDGGKLAEGEIPSDAIYSQNTDTFKRARGENV